MFSSISPRECWRVLIIALGVFAAFTAPARAGFTPISQPDASYIASSALLPITAQDFDAVSSLSLGPNTVSFDVPLVALTVPTTWGTWGSPPDVETATPRVLWTNGATSLTLSFSLPLQLFGAEAQPDTTVVSSITASFFLGASLVGEIPLDVDGNGGARLFAASSTTPFDSVVFNSTDGFALAQIRLRAVPEPSSLAILAAGIAGVLGIVRGRRAVH